MCCGLQFPTFTIAVTSPVISHAVSTSGLTQQTKVADYWSADITSVVASHLGSLSATGSMVHKDCSQGVLGQPTSALQVGQVGVQVAAVNSGTCNPQILRLNGHIQ